MSLSTMVYLDRSKMLEPEAWQAAIDEAGFDLRLDTDFEVWSHSGFLPATHQGNDSGFEYLAGDADFSFWDEGVDLSPIRPFDSMVDFVTHSDLREMVAASIAAAVLAHATGGVLVCGESGDTYRGNAAIEYARRQESSSQAELDDPNLFRGPPEPESPPETELPAQEPLRESELRQRRGFLVQTTKLHEGGVTVQERGLLRRSEYSIPYSSLSGPVNRTTLFSPAWLLLTLVFVALMLVIVVAELVGSETEGLSAIGIYGALALVSAVVFWRSRRRAVVVPGTQRNLILDLDEPSAEEFRDFLRLLQRWCGGRL